MANKTEEVKALIKRVDLHIDVDKLDVNMSLREQGIDSLDMFNIFLRIEEELDIKVPDTDLSYLRTISDIAEYISKHAS